MVKSYCVKNKIQTECVPGSERYVKAKNGRTMMKCICAKCGITKTKFVKSQSGGSINVASIKPYCGINEVPKNKYRGTAGECYNKNQIRYYGLNKVPIQVMSSEEKKLINKKKGD